MRHDVRALFQEVAGLALDDRESWYARQRISLTVRNEVESLLRFDSTANESITPLVRGAAELFLLSEAPVSANGRCGPYRLTRLLGHGGMGAVYLAERVDGEVEQQVAIKFVRVDHGLPSFQTRFLRERQILASLSHPGIARLLDAGRCDGQPYLVMEYVEGVRIDEYTASLDSRRILELFLRVAEAVAYAHQKLVVHRDLKPSNILVDASGQPKLLDFGIAKCLDASEVTQPGERAMTPEYASPEQLRGEPQATLTDVYSLGAVLYRLLTGRSPRSFRTTQPELPRDLAMILAKAMREQSEERYRSVDLLMSDVRAYLEHRPVEARRGSALYYARQFVRRRWLPLAAASVALAGITGGLLVVNRERSIAEQRFRQVRQLSQQFLDLDAEVRALPGSVKARTRIVTASLQYLERLSAETRRPRWSVSTTQDRELALEIAVAYLKVARVQGVPINSNLGQFAQARESLAKAGRYVDFALADPKFPQHRAALLTSVEIARDAMILAETDQHGAEAVALSEKADHGLTELLRGPNCTPEELTTATGVYVNMALAQTNMRRLPEAARYARRAVEVARLTGSKRSLGRALGVQANVSRFSGDLDGALRAIHESRLLAATQARPEDTESMLQLSAAFWREGLILGEYQNISFGRPREAAPLLQRALDIAEDLARKDPQDYTSRSYISMASRELGDVLRDSEPARALAVYDHALASLAEVPASNKTRRDSVWLLAGSAYPLQRLQRPREAAQRIERAFEALREINAYPQFKVELGNEVDAALRARANHQAHRGQTAAAIQTYEELYRGALATQPQPLVDLRHANGLSRLYRELEQLYRQSGRSTAAQQLQRNRLELWQAWQRKAPDNVFVQQQLQDAQQ